MRLVKAWKGLLKAACLHEWGVVSSKNWTLQVSHSVEMDLRHLDSLQTRSLRGSVKGVEGVAIE